MLIKKNFSQSRNPFSTNWFILVTITLFLICLRIPEGHCAEKDIQETLHARIKINVTWNIVSGNRINKGFLAVNVNGMLNYNREMSSPTHGLPSVMLTYDPQNMTWSYRYKEEDIGQKPPECPLNEEYHGSGSFSFRQPGQLMVHYLGGLYKGIPLKKTGHPETAGYLTGYYDFSIHPPELTAEGKRRYSSKCSYKPSTRKFNSSLSIRFKMKESGEMSGSRTWTSHWSTGRPTFTIGISDLGTPYKEKPYKPPAEDPGNVTYRVEWRIDKAPAIDIFRETEPDVFIPITNAFQDVIVGEKIKLKAVIYPEDKDPKQGEWSIGSITPKSRGTYKEKKFLKDFLVSGEKGEVVELTGEELKMPEIKFHWWDEVKNIKVKYKTTVDGKEVTGESTFNVKKPAITMSAETPQGVGGCYEFPATETQPKRVQLIYKKPEDLENRIPTIKFTRTEIPEDFPGETQYVQVVHEKGCCVKEEYAREPCLETNRAGLDTEYPYTTEREAKDNPGVPITEYDKEVTVMSKFQMYLEYKPAKEGAIFVPLRMTDWEWKGVLNWDPRTGKTCSVTRTENPRDKAAQAYPKWDQILTPEKEKPWDPCEEEKITCPDSFSFP